MQSFARKVAPTPLKTSFFLTGGPAGYATGDMAGFYAGAGLSKQIAKRWVIETALSASIFDSRHTAINFVNNTEVYNTQYRYSKTGIQLQAILQYQILALPKHLFSAGIGPAFRYQSNPSTQYILTATPTFSYFQFING